MRPRRRPGLLEGALVISLLAHAIALAAMRTSLGASSNPTHLMQLTRVTRVNLDPGNLRRYRETAVASVPAPRPAAWPGGPRVTYATPPVIELLTQPLPRRALRPPHRSAPQRVAVRRWPPVVARSDPPPVDPPAEASPSPSPAAAAAPTAPPSPVASTAPRLDAAQRTPAPVAAPPPPAAAADAAAVVPDATAGFAVLLGYHNDDRIQRDSQGYPVLDVAAISQLGDVKPVLAEVGKGSIPVAQAADYGLRPLDRVEAQVEVEIDAPSGMLTGPVQPRDVVLDDMRLVGRPLPALFRDKLARFIQDQVAGTQWLPASSYGNFQDRSRQVFRVQLIQIRDAALARLPMKPAASQELR